MKILLALTFSFLLNLGPTNGIKIIYKSDVPQDRSKMIYYKKKGHDYFERADGILKEVEKDIVHYAQGKDADLIEVYILEKANGEIPTESQEGKIGYVEILFSIMKN
ncbi:hypothetical protein [Shivajiella indica]|uniref:Uncharacterized protein n=1 Tax=Shivajiella indica TaxID=872115 RepID=A0ABW5B653_9BACT